MFSSYLLQPNLFKCFHQNLLQPNLFDCSHQNLLQSKIFGSFCQTRFTNRLLSDKVFSCSSKKTKQNKTKTEDFGFSCDGGNFESAYKKKSKNKKQNETNSLIKESLQTSPANQNFFSQN